MILALLLSCQEDPAADTAVPAAAAPFVALSPERLARRISVDLRGRLPTPEELDVAAQAGGLDTLVDTWMAEPAFEAHLVDVFAEMWQLRLDVLRVGPEEFGLDHYADAYAYTRAAGDEPARLMARIVANDQPWSDIVTVDTTMANDTLASFVPLEWIDPASTDEWHEARYTDGRPAGGVLMTSGLWLRYSTTIFNYNRGRAAALGRLLLCYDFLARPVVFSSLADESADGLAEAVSSDPGCLACHASLDPLAGALFGFWPFEDKDGVELVTYHPERERYGETVVGVSPAYFGTPIDAAEQLGTLVAQDPRFEMCAATRAAERLWGRPSTAEDLPTLVDLRNALRTDGQSYKALLRAVVNTEEYRAGDLEDSATEAQLDQVRTLRMPTPNTLAAMVEDATGFRWDYEGWDELDSDNTGFRVLLGGADGDLVRDTSLEPTLSRSLVIRRLAQGGASTVVAHDLSAARADRRLVGTTVDDLADATPGSAAFDAELTMLHRRLLATEPTAAQLAAEAELYTGVLAVSDTEGAWTSVVAVLLRDPDFWSY